MSKLEKLIAELCPNGVEYKTLDQIAENHDNERKPITSGNRESGQYPYYGASGIVDYVKDYIFDGDFLLISEDGANLIARNTPIAFSISGKNWVNNHAHILMFDSIITQKFVEHYLGSLDLTAFISGAAQPKLNQKNLNKIPIPFPPLPVQSEIVRILDNFTELTAELTTELTARKKQYEYYRDDIINSNNNFNRVKLGEICRIGDGLHSTPKYSDRGSYFFINGNNLNSGTIIIDEKTKKVDEKEYEKYKIAFTDSTIFMSINGTIGKIAYYKKEPVILGKSAAYFITNSDILDCKYLYYYLQSNDAINYFTNNLTGSTILNLGLKALRELEIPLPPLSEQQRIVDILDRFDTLCNDISTGLPAEIEARQKQYEYYRDKLLTFKELS